MILLRYKTEKEQIRALQSLCHQVADIHDSKKVILYITPEMVECDETGKYIFNIADGLYETEQPIIPKRDMISWKRRTNSPELYNAILRGNAILPNCTSDVYSLMIVYSFLLTGKYPEPGFQMIDRWTYLIEKGCDRWENNKKTAMQSLFRKCTTVRMDQRIRDCRQLIDSEEYRTIER